jgi:hypothetical protein
MAGRQSPKAVVVAVVAVVAVATVAAATAAMSFLKLGHQKACLRGRLA